MIEVSDELEVVGVYTDQFVQVFEDAHQIRVIIGEEAQLMKQPRENGTTSVDHRILLPITAHLTVMLSPDNYRNAYQQIKTEFIKGTSFNIKTRTTIHTNMVLQAMPREETATAVDLIQMQLSFEEVLYQSAQFQTLPPRSVSNKSNSSKVKRGEQAGTKKNGSTLYRTVFGN